MKGDAASLPAFRILISLPPATIQLQLQSSSQKHRRVNQIKSTTIITWKMLPAVEPLNPSPSALLPAMTASDGFDFEAEYENAKHSLKFFDEAILKKKNLERAV
jgi:hypothetical protein